MLTHATASDSSPPTIEIRQRELDDHTIVVEIDGELDVATAPTLKWRLVDALESGGRHLVLDLSGVSFMDSTAIGVLVGVKRHLQAGGRLAIASPLPDVQKIFEVTGLDASFHISSTVDDALTQVRAGGRVED
jgi:anti-sigma B factor antagonist